MLDVHPAVRAWQDEMVHLHSCASCCAHGYELHGCAGCRWGCHHAWCSRAWSLHRASSLGRPASERWARAASGRLATCCWAPCAPACLLPPCRQAWPVNNCPTQRMCTLKGHLQAPGLHGWCLRITMQLCIGGMCSRTTSCYHQTWQGSSPSHAGTPEPVLPEVLLVHAGQEAGDAGAVEGGPQH